MANNTKKLPAADQATKLVDLGNATRQTKGYNFDYVQEIQPFDKKYDFN